MRSLKESGPRFCEVETIDGTVLVPFTVKRSRRLRYIRVSVNELMEVTLKIPWQVSEVAAMEFFRSQGNWVAGIAWADFLSAQGHNPWYCMHLSVCVGPLKRGESKTVKGRIYLFEGDGEACLEKYKRDFG